MSEFKEIDKCREEFLKDFAGIVPCWCEKELMHYEYDEKANCFRFEGHGKYSNYTIALNNMWCIYQHQQVKVAGLEEENLRLAQGNTSYYNQAINQNEIIDGLQGKLKQAYEDIDTFAEAHERELGFKAQFAKDKEDLQKRVEWLEDRLKATDTLSKMRAAVIGSFNTQEFNARTRRKMMILKKTEQALDGGEA